MVVRAWISPPRPSVCVYRSGGRFCVGPRGASEPDSRVSVLLGWNGLGCRLHARLISVDGGRGRALGSGMEALALPCAAGVGSGVDL